MERWLGRVALITGASAGIGLDLASHLLKHGMKVVGCARNIDAIESLPDPKCLRAIRCDVSKEDQIKSMFNTIDAEFGGVDICVSNAGVGFSDTLLTGSTEAWRNMLEVNVLGLAIVNREAVASMKRKGVDDGHVVLVNSMSGHRVIPSPTTSMYTASKYAVTAIAEGMRYELRTMQSGIRVSSVSPGLVDTEFIERGYGQEKAKEILAKDVLQATDVSEAIIYAISSPPSVQIHDILMRHTNQIN